MSVVGLTLSAIWLTALLNCDDLVKVAQRQPFGWQRTVALRVAEVDKDISHALLLDRPRRALDELLGHRKAGVPAIPVTPVSPAVTPTSPASPSTTPTAPARVPPSAAHPLRVYFGGDSVAAAVSAAFARGATATKVMRTSVDYRVSTGLSRPDYFDWPQRLRDVISRKSGPQVVIVMFGANDIQPIMTPTGPADTGTRKWLTEYDRRVAALMDYLSSTGVDVYWLGQPLMRSATFTRLVNGVDAIYAQEARRHAHITFVDTRPVLADSHGHYSAYVRDSRGHEVLVRAPDGVHLTEAGGARVAAEVLERVASAWQVRLG